MKLFRLTLAVAWLALPSCQQTEDATGSDEDSSTAATEPATATTSSPDSASAESSSSRGDRDPDSGTTGAPVTTSDSTGDREGTSSSGGEIETRGSGSSSGDDPIEPGSSSGGDTIPGHYDPCMGIPPFLHCDDPANLFCATVGDLNQPTHAVCSAFTCNDASDCPAAPATGTAEPACADFVAGDGFGECFLDCSAGQSCPAGMVCFANNLCVWPQ